MLTQRYSTSQLRSFLQTHLRCGMKPYGCRKNGSSIPDKNCIQQKLVRVDRGCGARCVAGSNKSWSDLSSGCGSACVAGSNKNYSESESAQVAAPAALWSPSPRAPKRKRERRSEEEREYTDCPFQCETCGLGVASRFSLTRHLKRHTGARPFKCEHPQCNKAFAEKSTLRRHEMTHSGERPYKCKNVLCPAHLC